MKRYVIAYKEYPNDPMVTHKGRPIVCFNNTVDDISRFKKYLIAFVVQDDKTTLERLKAALKQKIGRECEIVFTPNNPTIWKEAEVK